MSATLAEQTVSTAQPAVVTPTDTPVSSVEKTQSTQTVRMSRADEIKMLKAKSTADSPFGWLFGNKVKDEL